MELTREEQYLAYLSGTGTALPEPITRNERYLYNLCKNGTGGAKTWDDLGYSPTGGDTLTWDGNTEGLESVDMGDGSFLYKISDATPSLAEAQQGFVMGKDAEPEEFVGEQIAFLNETIYAFMGGDPSYGMVVLVDNADFFGVTIPSKGLYILGAPSDSYFLTIPGYTGFPSVNKVPEEYLPWGKTVAFVNMDWDTGVLETTPAQLVEWVNVGVPVILGSAGWLPLTVALNADGALEDVSATALLNITNGGQATFFKLTFDPDSLAMTGQTFYYAQFTATG